MVTGTKGCLVGFGCCGRYAEVVIAVATGTGIDRGNMLVLVEDDNVVLVPTKPPLKRVLDVLNNVGLCGGHGNAAACCVYVGDEVTETEAGCVTGLLLLLLFITSPLVEIGRASCRERV